MAVLLSYTYFRSNGHTLSAGQMSLPEWLDWKGIDEKEVFFRYISGMPQDAHYAMITSQGQTKLLSNLEAHKGELDYKEYRRKIDGAEQEVDRLCRERGIDRTRIPRNQ